MIMESANFDPSTNDKNVMRDSCLDILNLNLVFSCFFFLNTDLLDLLRCLIYINRV